MADALFTINGDSSNQGFDAGPGDLLTLRLKTLPVSGVQTVRFQVWDATAFDPDEDAIVNPPRKARDSPSLTLVGATTGKSVSPAALDGEVETTLPGTENHAWIVRCVVNGGESTLADGRVVFDPRLVHERMIVIRDSDTGGRPIVATETTQYEDDGWAPEAGRPGGPGTPFTPATGDADGFLSRHVYVNAASTLVGGQFFGVDVEVATTLTTPEQIPPGNLFRAITWGSGATGGTGPQQTSNASSSSGSSGAGGGARQERWFSRRDLIAALPIAMTIAPTTAAPVPNTTAAAGSQNGNPGTNTRFGSLLQAHGGGPGGTAGTKTGGSGGSFFTAGTLSDTSSIAGADNPVVNTPGIGGAGAGSSTTSGGKQAMGGGGASGGGSGPGTEQTNPSPRSVGGVADTGGGGGGGAGGVGAGTGTPASSGVTASGGAGGDGGASGSTGAVRGGGGLGGAASALAANSPGNDGADGANATSPDHSGAGGGGGGACGWISSPPGGGIHGGKGGNGGIPAGGGGAGGPGRGADGTAWRGHAGTGGEGMIVLEAYA